MRPRGGRRDVSACWSGAEALERVRGPQHPCTLNRLGHSAVLLYAKGDHAGAEPLPRRTQEARERALGPEHPDTLKSRKNLATLMEAQNASGRTWKGDLVSFPGRCLRRLFSKRAQ